MISRILCIKNILQKFICTSEVVFNILDEQTTEKRLFELKMLPQKSNHILNWLKIDKIYLLNQTRFELLPVAEIRLIFNPLVSDNDTIRNNIWRWLWFLRFVDDSSFLIAMFQGIGSKKIAVVCVRLEYVHFWAVNKRIYIIICQYAHYCHFNMIFRKFILNKMNFIDVNHFYVNDAPPFKYACFCITLIFKIRMFDFLRICNLFPYPHLWRVGKEPYHSDKCSIIISVILLLGIGALFVQRLVTVYKMESITATSQTLIDDSPPLTKVNTYQSDS